MTESANDLGAQIAEHGRFLHNLAALQLGSRTDAEDVVQETLLAALSGISSFVGQVPIRSWLLGILRHKIIDAIRQKKHRISIDLSDETLNMDADSEHLFTTQGMWQHAALHGGQCPAAKAERRQLLDLIEQCMSSLPPTMCRLFLMREYLGFEFAEIAAELKLSENNLRVMLYRARMRLRDCVSQAWGEIL